MDVLLVAAKKDLIDDYVQVITDAGLTPVVIDVAAFAVENAFEANYDSSRQRGRGAGQHRLAGREHQHPVASGAPAFTRDISTGGNAYTEEIQKALSVSWEEAERIKIGGGSREESQDVVPQEVEQAIRGVTDTVIGEISRSLDFFAATAAESRIARVMLAGGGSRVSGFESAFQGKTNLPVSRLEPARAHGSEQPLRRRSPRGARARRSPWRSGSQCGGWTPDDRDQSTPGPRREAQGRTSGSSPRCSVAALAGSVLLAGAVHTKLVRRRHRHARSRSRSSRSEIDAFRSAARAGGALPRHEAGDRDEARGDRPARPLALGPGAHPRRARDATRPSGSG